MNDNYFQETSSHEWLLTNNLGGYALGTGNLINQRKYHGLLISSDKNLNRHHLLAGLEIMLEWRGETCYLDSANYSSCIYPEGFLNLVKSWLRPYPVFLYSSLHHNNDILIKIELMMAENENSILVKITNLSRHKLNFIIRPKLTMRNHHDTNPYGYWDERSYDLQIADRDFNIGCNDLSLACRIGEGAITNAHLMYRDCYYPWEAIRGYYGVEDQLSPVKISFSLTPNEVNGLIFSDSKSNIINTTFSRKIDSIEKRYQSLPLPRDYPDINSADKPLLRQIDYEDQIMFDRKDYLKILKFSLHDFLIEDDIIAGYPWFGCWGRDTFIYFDALLTSDVNHRLCWTIIKKYASMIKDGLIPNMLDESGIGQNYHSIDATLWFVLSIYDLVNKVVSKDLYGNKTIVKESISYCKQVITGIINSKGNFYYIDKDGLLYLNEDFASATWMDAKVDGKAVTPRTGAPVEINALLYNALCCYREMVDNYQPPKISERKFIDDINKLAKKIKDSFSRFWTGDFLADRLEMSGVQVREIRPNALIASSLPFPLLPSDKLKALFQTATNELATPYGLRSLSLLNPRFKKKYLGNQKERDAQYHQGTVWAWLLDPYVKTYYQAYKDDKSPSEMINDISKIINNLRTGYMKGHIASVAEVWDGDKPHFPKGCPAQAWSVAALYNIEMLINNLELKK